MTDLDDPRRDDEPAFETPWQARAFALALSLTDRGEGELPWDDFQARLVAEIDRDGDDVAGSEVVYYEQWLRALERLLVDEGLVDQGDLEARVAAFERGDRDASEFVIGEHGHAHDHEHGHGHDHG